MKKKILFCGGGTGGHVFPAISLAKFFNKKQYEAILITDTRGAKFLKNDFLNYKIIYISGTTKFSIINRIFFYIKLIPAFINAILYLKKEKPSIVFGLGGYVSFPICLAANILNVKILLYEPNSVLGRVNKFFLGNCKKIFTKSNSILNFPEKYLHKCVIRRQPKCRNFW